MKQKFMQDLQSIYDYYAQQKNNLNLLFGHLENKNYKELQIIDDFAKHLNLELNDISRLALLNRLINLREDALILLFNNLGFKEKEIDEKKELAFDFVAKFWHELQKQRISFINDNHLLSEFYRAIFSGVFEIGLKFTNWQKSWHKKIIIENNRHLADKFENDDAKIMNFLTEKNLLDLGHNNQISERCYSALDIKGEKIKSLAYASIFKNEVTAVVNKLEELEDQLIGLEDEIFGQKWEYVLYFQELIKALSQTEPNKLVSLWADVDRAWMKIKTPIQIGHPLEYYEDHYRKAVALEWDLRLANPNALNTNRAEIIKKGFEEIYSKLDIEFKNSKIYKFCISSIDKVQIYISQPALFFGSQFNGLFSAQVVPNDEVVSFEFGKKIFAYSQNILATQRAKPFMKISRIVFGDEFVRKERKFLFSNESDWYKVYDISTIGHEFGHILWCDENTEIQMNKSGNFKNIEEFKATTGGLIAHFCDIENQNITEFVLMDLIKRSVGLISWMKTDDVRPYYCEGIIHLDILFKAGVLDFNDNKLSIDMSKYDKLKEIYFDIYILLAKTYLEKMDASIFLEKFAKKEEKYFVPINQKVYDFTKYYFDLYERIGQEIDTEDKKSNYIQ